MAIQSAQIVPSETLALRREAGEWLRNRREELGLSQTDLAKLVGAEYYSFISQIENGRGKIPSNRFRDWAVSLRMEPKFFVQNILKYYDPHTHAILFENEA